MCAKNNFLFLLILVVLSNCSEKSSPNSEVENTTSKLEGTWKLISAQMIVNNDTTFTDYTQDMEGIKIINETHFSFLQHDLKKGEDSAAVFTSGGGRYILKGNTYVEFLEYCSAREWENHKFEFTIDISNDTLFQTGREKIASLDVDRVIIETYVRTDDKNTPIPVLKHLQ